MTKPASRHYGVSDLCSFINLLAERRKDKLSWALVHVKVVGQEHAKGRVLAELRQLLDYALQTIDAWMMSSPATGELVVLADNHQRNIQHLIDQLVREHCDTSAIRILIQPLSEKGLQQVQAILSQMIPEGDRASRLGLQRLLRRGNVFLVIDDDPILLKQMEHMLQAIGHVETCSAAPEFLERYIKYAPNAVFVDINLRGENGTAITAAVLQKIDPFAHAIIISADAIKDNVLLAKSKGAKGFLGKPVSRDQLLRVALAAPTFIARRG